MKSICMGAKRLIQRKRTIWEVTVQQFLQTQEKAHAESYATFWKILKEKWIESYHVLTSTDFPMNCKDISRAYLLPILHWLDYYHMMRR